MLSDNENSKCEVSNATKSIRVISFIWNANDMHLEIKVRSHNNILLELLLWCSKSWNSNMVDVKKNEVF